jgi:transcription initiation factor TFIIIB Brf1 subunit/transcription initiation factor TFIIB
MPYSERMLLEVSNTLKGRLTGKFSPRIINDTLTLYKKFFEDSGIHRGSNKQGFVAVCLYISCSDNFATVTPDEVSFLIGVDVKIFHKCLQKYTEIIGTKLVTSGTVFVDSFINKLGVPFKIRKPTVKILEYVEKTGIIGCAMPQNSCITVIFFVAKEMGINLDKNLVTKEFNISTTTIDKNLGILLVNKQIIFNALKSS